MSDDFTKDLIKSLNKDHGSRVAYNLAEDGILFEGGMSIQAINDCTVTVILDK